MKKILILGASLLSISLCANGYQAENILPSTKMDNKLKTIKVDISKTKKSLVKLIENYRSVNKKIDSLNSNVNILTSKIESLESNVQRLNKENNNMFKQLEKNHNDLKSNCENKKDCNINFISKNSKSERTDNKLSNDDNKSDIIYKKGIVHTHMLNIRTEPKVVGWSNVFGNLIKGDIVEFIGTPIVVDTPKGKSTWVEVKINDYIKARTGTKLSSGWINMKYTLPYTK
jgi:hypothetical protein